MPAETRKHSFIRLVVVGFTLCFAGQSYSQSVIAPAQDPLAGSRVFGSKGCAKCHAVNGVGAKVGPDLGRIQANRSFNDLAEAMWNHGPTMAEAMLARGIERPSLNASELRNLVAYLRATAPERAGRR